MSIDWLEPEATVRGSVVVITGRGEHAGVYGRFARRIAVDGYRVTVAEGGSGAALAAIDAAQASLPVVVVGSDTGASEALTVAAARPVVTGVVAAGLLTDTAVAPGVDWDGELEIRSACPVHRGVLDSDAVDRGALAIPATAVTAEVLAANTVPTLVVHGSADVVSAADQVRRLAQELPEGRIVIVNDGRHDILNDVSHRSVAAEIVQFLERLRLPGAPDIITRIPAGVLTG
ncbi:alpha/beta hydrolase [Gordonia rubripertincta]|uniref:Alpha/beta hydrolase n=1 Tax=Gordonia rubripertincta TaxID=36822 RepID=A0ABT4MXW3_GORRU|nr:alpha/beta hydrolase [Gordonia rubripertincta]MCZ4551855.1 alpha/beta hydrolase [Gordonia rubripertincta]